MKRVLWLVAAGLAALIAAGTATAQAQGSARTAELEMQLVTRPNDPLLYVELARERERLGDRARAEATLRSGIAAAADPRPVRAALADFLARAERWTDAIAVAESLGRDSRSLSIVARLRVNAGVMSYRAGNKTAARAQWERALQEDPGLAQAAVDLGAMLFEQGQREAARAVVTRALTLHPDHEQLLSLRSALMGGPEAAEAAAAQLKRRRAAAKQDERLGLQLAELLASIGKRREAAALFDTLLTAAAPSEAAFQSTGRFWVDGEQPALATQVVERGLERYPRSGALLALLGDAQANAKEWRRAATAYRRAAGLLPSPEDAELRLINALVHAADTAGALDVAREMEIRPAERAALLEAAKRATALGAPLLADSIYRDLLARDPQDLDALEADGQIAEQQKDTARAVALYARASDQDSAGPIAPLGLRRLTHPDAAGERLLLRRAAWRGVAELQRLELQTAALATGPVDVRTIEASRPALERRKLISQLLESTLDTVVLGRSWGKEELEQLRLAYPGSALLERFTGAVAEREGNDSTALVVYDAVLRRDPTDAATQAARAALLARTGRASESLDAYTRALDLTPEDDGAFRALQRARQADGSLELLLAQIRRLRVRLPRSRVLVDHEIEVLQRLGRLQEAADTARKHEERRP